MTVMGPWLVSILLGLSLLPGGAGWAAVNPGASASGSSAATGARPAAEGGTCTTTEILHASEGRGARTAPLALRDFLRGQPDWAAPSAWQELSRGSGAVTFGFSKGRVRVLALPAGGWAVDSATWCS